jgi:predicted transcriptional regulator
MAKEIPSLGELEIRVLQLVWRHQPCTERQVSDLVREERSVARTTVLKTIQRLEAKKLLVRAGDKSPIHYRAAVSEKHLLPALVDRFVDRVLGGAPDPLVAYFANSGKLSNKDLKTLEAIARKVKEESDN